MNEIKVFENPKFGSIRTVEQNGEPWFVVADVCKSLELGNPSQAMTRLDADEKSTLISNEGKKLNIVNEPGLYTLVLSSRKPEAKLFKRWITHEVLPSIRKTGGYISGQENMSDSELMAKALLVAQRQINQRDARIAEMQPKALFADSVAASKTSILIGELAKILKQNGVETGQKRLFVWMRENGYLIRRKGTDYNMPTQRAMELKLFEIKETVVNHADGHQTANKTPKVTGKGQVYFINLLLKEAER